MIFYNENFGASLSWNLYNNILILCVTLYRFGSWTSYEHETGIIRTSMTRRGT